MPPAIEPFGLSAPCVLPITAQHTVDLEKFLAHVKWALASGCDSITLFGSTGEGPSIGQGEKNAILATLSDAGIDFGRSVVGAVAATSVADAVEQSRRLLEAGCKQLLMAPPFYFKNVADDGVFDWFSAVFEKLGGRARDVLLYNMPSVTSVPFSLDLVGRLRRAFPDVIVGVKDASGNWLYTQSLLAEHRDLVILVGDETRLGEAIGLGAQGSISGYGNTFPRICLEVIAKGESNPPIAAMNKAMSQYPAIQAIKALVAHRTGDLGWLNVLPPMRSLAPDAARTFAVTINELISA